MGLDMYLTTKKYIYGYEIGMNKDKYDKIVALCEFSDIVSEDSPFLTITATVGYWRKANQIHAWFVENCQGGNDDCEECYVDNDKLNILYNLCKRVKDEPSLASELLPTSKGFFFGSNDYDEWYMNDIAYTIKLLERLLPLDLDLYYQSSW